jgi:hypothetical protein
MIADLKSGNLKIESSKLEDNLLPVSGVALLLSDASPLPSNNLPTAISLNEYIRPLIVAADIFALVGTFICRAVSHHGSVPVHLNLHTPKCGVSPYRNSHFYRRRHDDIISSDTRASTLLLTPLQHEGRV